MRTRFGTYERGLAENAIDVLCIQPGYADPEWFIGTLHQRLQAAELAGHRYRHVIFDAVHNALYQTPSLQREPLLWPTVLRMLRVRHRVVVPVAGAVRVEQRAERPLAPVAPDVEGVLRDHLDHRSREQQAGEVGRVRRHQGSERPVTFAEAAHTGVEAAEIEVVGNGLGAGVPILQFAEHLREGRVSDVRAPGRGR